MNDHQQPEALRLADWLDADACDLQTPRAAAAELRRLHAENEALRKANAEAIRLLSIGHRNASTALGQVGFAYMDKGYSGTTVRGLSDAMSAMHHAIMDLTAAAREAQATETRLSGEAKGAA